MTAAVTATSSAHLSICRTTIDYKYALTKFCDATRGVTHVTAHIYQGITWLWTDLTPARTSAATELRESMMAVTRQMRRHRPDNGLTLSQMQLLGEISRAGVTTPAELGSRMHVRVQSLTDSINELVGRELIARRPDEADRRRQLIEITAAGTALLEADRAERDAWLHATMRDNLSQLEFDLLMLVAPVLRKLAYADAKVGTLAV